MRLLFAILVLFGLASTAFAGPWPREKSQVYAYVGHISGDDPWTSIYAEYGGPRDLTFGLEAGGHFVDAAASDADGRLWAFVRRPILTSRADTIMNRPGLAPWLFALEFGAGADFETDGTVAPRIGVGLSAGRSLSTGFGDGWTSLDLKMSLDQDANPRINLSGVVGVKPTPRITVEMGLFAEFEDDVSVTISPAVQYDLGRAGAAQLGLAVKSDGGTALTLGWARTF